MTSDLERFRDHHGGTMYCRGPGADGTGCRTGIAVPLRGIALCPACHATLAAKDAPAPPEPVEVEAGAGAQ